MARKASTLQRLPLSPVIGAMFGAAAAVLVAATPDFLFEQAVGATGFGMRLLAMIAAFAVVGGLVWALVAAAERMMAAPVAPRARDELDLATFEQALPVSDATRRPISAGELGAPLMSDAALRTIEPLSDERPATIPDLSPPAQAAIVPPEEQLPEEAPAVETVVPAESSIEALIARLEAGLARHGRPTPPPTSGGNAVPVTPARGSAWIVREGEGGNDPSAALRRAVAR